MCSWGQGVRAEAPEQTVWFEDTVRKGKTVPFLKLHLEEVALLAPLSYPVH